MWNDGELWTSTSFSWRGRSTNYLKTSGFRVCHNSRVRPPNLAILCASWYVWLNQVCSSFYLSSNSAPSRQVIAGGEGISRLVGLLGDKECFDLHVLTMEVLGLCLADTDSMSILQGSGCLGQFLTHVSDSSSQQMKTHAANTLAVAATNGVLATLLACCDCRKCFQPWIGKFCMRMKQKRLSLNCYPKRSVLLPSNLQLQYYSLFS